VTERGVVVSRGDTSGRGRGHVTGCGESHSGCAGGHMRCRESRGASGTSGCRGGFSRRRRRRWRRWLVRRDSLRRQLFLHARQIRRVRVAKPAQTQKHTSSSWRRLNRARWGRGGHVPLPNFTNGWARGYRQ